jgi:hypothetical protein
VKLLVVAALIAASVPAVPMKAAPELKGGCARPDARVREPGEAGRERNALTPSQVTAVEEQLNGLLSATDQFGRTQLRSRGQVTVPVYFHVLHDGANGNVGRAAIERQVSVLNASYGGGNGGADTRFRFVLRDITRSDNPGWYSNPEQYETTFKPRLREGGSGSLNLYSANTGDELLGWSTFPWKYAQEPKMDGVVIHVGSMPGGSIEHFNRGFSATHETGHWLGLYHTFQDGCSDPGDRVSDTPPERDPTNGCPLGKDTCDEPGADPVHNYMDYGWDTCMNQFTGGQGARMRMVWSAYRA